MGSRIWNAAWPILGALGLAAAAFIVGLALSHDLTGILRAVLR